MICSFPLQVKALESIMGNSASTQTPAISSPPSTVTEKKDTTATGEKPKCKACCACPETKKARDAW